ncbi:thyroid transcription factor 1-associated protein 26 homolog [Carcharodon carcharias]|uniref:thyroid transcription factor 1-associated protein 26 homolog n=1 Tax=Carcharodon carcharias TaxID=13397 RepID=UPI001B7E4899|nr:thyroid transcription factor 1-associated protein 26 homolog [Carcharodon carcharias]
MAPSSRKGADGGGSFKGKGFPGPSGQKSKQKHRWRANHFKKGWGSIKEGQGFAFQQKNRIKHEYKKLLRKEKKAQHPQEIQYTENYPDHLRHLYLAEEELLKKQSEKAKKSQTVAISQPDSQAETTKKEKSKSSYQKSKEEYEKRQAEHIKQKEAAEERQRAKEEAQRKYKEQKLEKYRILSKKTRKGQPNLNIQMEYLLKKIQDNQGIK